MHQRPASFDIQITFQKSKIINSAGPKNIQHKAFLLLWNAFKSNFEFFTKLPTFICMEVSVQAIIIIIIIIIIIFILKSDWSSDRPQSIPLPYVCYRTSSETLQKEFGTSHRFILFAKQTSEITFIISVWNAFHRISRILFCFIQRQLHKSTEISLALIFLISKLFGLLSGMKLKEFFSSKLQR